MAGEELLERVAAAGELLAQAVHLGRRHRRGERARGGGVRREELELRHAAHGGADRQAPGVAQQRRRVGAVVDEQLLLRRHLHEDHAQVLPVRRRERQLLEPAAAGGVHRHLHAVEVVALDRLRHDRAVGVARHADEPRHLLLAHLVERLQRAVRRLDLRQVGGVLEAVQVEQVEVVGLEPLQAGLDVLQGGVAGPRGRRHLGREEHVPAAGGHHAADARLALAVPVVHGGVEVVDAEVERALEHRRRLVGRVREEAAAAAEGEDRHLDAGAAQGAVRQFRGLGRAAERGQRRGRAHRQAAALQELAPADTVLRRHAPLRCSVHTGLTPASSR